jgi:hypothetical protein
MVFSCFEKNTNRMIYTENSENVYRIFDFKRIGLIVGTKIEVEFR